MANLKEELSRIWETRRALIEERLVSVEQAAAALECHSCSADQQAKAKENAHALAGSLGAFGLMEASESAREAENLLRTSRLLNIEIGRLGDLARALRCFIENGPKLK